MRLLPLALLVALAGCGVHRSHLSMLELGMTPRQVHARLGEPMTTEIRPDGVRTEGFNLYWYHGAIAGVSPFYDRFEATFQDNGLAECRLEWSGATEEDAAAAFELVAILNEAAGEFSRAVSGGGRR